jgi:hypothetical protein
VTACTFDMSPCEHLSIEQLQDQLGLKNPQIASQLYLNRFLRVVLNDRLRTSLEPLPQDIPDSFAELFSIVVMSGLDELVQLSRKITILINHGAILRTTDGSLLTSIVKWCGSSDLIRFPRNGGLPKFSNFPVLSGASYDNLELYSLKVQAHLIGMLPRPYHQRLRLRFPEEQLRSALYFASDDPDFEKFIEFALTAQSIFPVTERDDAEN